MTKNLPDGFASPDFEALAEDGLIADDLAVDSSVEQISWAADGGEEVGGAPAEEVEFPQAFRARWAELSAMAPADALARVEAEFGDQPQQARAILSLVIAQDLNYRRGLRRAHTQNLQQKPLWDVLSAEVFEELGAQSVEALARVSRSTRPGRRALHPMAALATLALWQHGDAAEQQESGALLVEFSLPDSPDWLYELVGELMRQERRGGLRRWRKKRASSQDELSAEELLAERPRGLYALAKLQLDAGHWDAAALLAGFYLTRRLAPGPVGAPMTRLLKATDRAAMEYPQKTRLWLDVMADATVGGRLNYPWLERPMSAAIRLSFDDIEREARLRAWHDQHPYEVGHQRLFELYETDLLAMVKGDEDAQDRARRRLLNAVEHTARRHPIRARQLLEWVVIQEHPRRLPTPAGKLNFALEQVAKKPQLTKADETLVRLYVETYHIEPHAMELVRQTMDRVDWEDPKKEPGAQALKMYLVISDYERAFEHLRCKFDGVSLEHADKDAAARVKNFVEQRLNPNQLTRFVRTLFTPMEWLGQGLGHLEFISKAVERAVVILEDRIARVDLSERVLEDYREAGVEVEDFEDISQLNMAQVDRLMRKRRTMRLLISAAAGGISGGLAPLTGAMLTLADAPVLLALSADICSRFCWYYGFDPREYPELPMEIMAVALGGSRAEAIEPMLLRQNIKEYAMGKSLVVGAIAHGGVTQAGARGLNRLLQQQIGERAAGHVQDLARRAVSTGLHRRTARAVPSKTLPMLGAALGASLNVALIYDVCEAAQAVLTDRFLERKYPDWIRKFDPETYAAPDISLD